MTSEPDEDLREDSNPPPANLPPAKPGGLEIIVIILFLLFVAWGTYEFGIFMIIDGGKTPQETTSPF